MTDLLFPDVRIQRLAPRIIDNTGRFSSPFTQATRTISRGGDRWGFTVTLNDLGGVDRARVESLIANLRGAANRVLFSPIDFPQRGSFPSGEKLTNNNFANGLANWTIMAAATGTAVDRRARITFSGGVGPVGLSQTPSNLATNLPHVARYFLVDGKGTPLALGGLQSYIEGSATSAQVVSAEGLNVIALVPDAPSGGQYPTWNGVIPVGQIAGNYVEVVWTSLSQCMLVDNGPNLLQFSDTLASPWTTSAASVAANVATAADGTVTAASITDTVANSPHYLAQGALALPSATQTDMMLCGEFKAAAQSFVYLQIVENTSGTYAYQFFNLATGAIATGSGGANWTGLRAFIVPLGNGWYYCAIVARKTNAATVGSVQFGPSNSGSVFAYAGAASVAINSRRLTCSQSSVPTRQVQTAGAVAPGTLQTGSAYKVKGLPASTAGLLLPGDWVEINKELKRVTAQLDSDAAGTGYLQFSPPIRTSAADDDPVIVNRPMGRFIFSATETGWDASPAGLISGPRATYTLDLIEAA